MKEIISKIMNLQLKSKIAILAGTLICVGGVSSVIIYNVNKSEEALEEAVVASEVSEAVQEESVAKEQASEDAVVEETVIEDADNIDTYKKKMEESKTVLEEDYDNEEAIANYVYAFLKYSEKVQEQGEESTEADVDDELLTYLYSYAKNTDPKTIDMEKIYADAEKKISESGTYEFLDTIPALEEMSIECTIPKTNGSEQDMTEDTELIVSSNSEVYGFPHNTCPAGMWLIGILPEENGVTIVIGVDWHQLVENEVYYRWVDERLAKGMDPNELTWDIYYSLSWLEGKPYQPGKEETESEQKAETTESKPVETVPEENEVVEEAKVEKETSEEVVNNNSGANTARGNSSYWQTITGDKITINGQVPTALFTQIQDTPVGQQISLQLLDENHNIIAVMTGDDLEHTNYQYAYIKSLDIGSSYVIFTVAGSDTEVSGNLQYAGEGVMETEYGIEQNTSYDDLREYMPEGYVPEGECGW